MNPFAENDPCPCESGLAVRDCCAPRSFVPPPVRTCPQKARTGLRVARCYAQLLRDCGGKVSAEHAIARQISSTMGNGPIERVLSNGRHVKAMVGTAGRKILCQRHNSSLSPLDTVGRRFVQAVLEHKRRAYENISGDVHVLFNGYDVERWMLKVLCASTHDQPISRTHHCTTPWRVPRLWSDILFHGARFPPGAGLYVPKVRRNRMPNGIMTAVVTGIEYQHRNGVPLLGTGQMSVLGISLSVYGKDMDLLMSRPIERDMYHFRVRQWRTTRMPNDPCNRCIHLGWPDNPPTFAGKTVSSGREEPQDPLLRC